MKQASEAGLLRKVIGASSLGTMIEWYDFYIFGMLAKTISTEFFPEGNSTAALLSTLAIFAAGFIVRPFGALFFGRLGDLLGRKSTFLLTLVLMGGSTFLIGLVPGYRSIGIAAPLIVLLLRLLQGLALGGEYGGAATYVAEHAPAGKRGFYTSWIQTTATLGLFLALGVIMLVKMNLPDEQFNAEWGGWRYPFWFSILLVIVSVYIRLKMQESPLFAKLKSEGKVVKNPLKESFRKRDNFKMVLLALFGAAMGQGVIWYTGQFYAQSFLETKVALNFEQSRSVLLWAILFATPFFIFFGWLSDKAGRKWIMLLGMLLGVLTYRPIFNALLENAKTEQASEGNRVLSGTKKQSKLLAGTADSLITVTRHFELAGGIQYVQEQTDTLRSATTSITEGKPVIKDKVLPKNLYWKYVGLVFLLILYVTMVYGPIAAFLVELFPVHIRYTSMSLPYHIGNGVFGGLVPFIGVLLQTTFTEDPLVGLWYPIGIAALSFIIGAVYLRNRTPAS
ncbi:MFS transporter [Niabella ginsenosidivorans]|uniref:MFS transporter n=1 Tax=Niabella ginsenosidivorans TaxID=1176587 RepID=A0A1A9HX78_9BACT|nr:MFS transporter [Niabella ginsenosidivorans]ANH79986.1 MFS transporter [Niabella ginsenosidivorans]